MIADSQFGLLLEPFGSDFDRRFKFGKLFGPRIIPAISADLARFGQPPQKALDSDFMTVVRGPDRYPGDSGQWGIAFRFLAEELNQTEFGFHFGNYHSRLPVLAAHTGSLQAIQAGLAAACAVGADGSATSMALAGPVTPAGKEAVTAQVMAAVRAGAIDPAAAPSLIEEQIKENACARICPLVQGIAASLAIDRYTATPDPLGNTGHFFLEYPDDVRFLGLSFNTALGTSGWALQGEYTLHIDAPLQRAERSLIAEGIGPMLTALGLAAQNPAALPDFLGSYRPGDLQGYIRHDVSQVQATATRVFGPALGADAFVFVTEAAAMHVHEMTNQPLESPARKRRLSDPNTDADTDATSWGYRLAARLDYSNAIGAANLYPYVQWGHDVSGNSPSPSGPFAEGRTSLTLGVRADYLSRWEANVGYTIYGGLRNELYDRDFVSASIKYSF